MVTDAKFLRGSTAVINHWTWLHALTDWLRTDETSVRTTLTTATDSCVIRAMTDLSQTIPASASWRLAAPNPFIIGGMYHYVDTASYRTVFSSRRKTGREDAFRTCCGRAFHGRRTGKERSTTTRSERVLSSRLPPRTEDRSVPVVVPWCDLTMYHALSVRPSLSADLSPCTAVTNCLLLTLYGGPAAAVQ